MRNGGVMWLRGVWAYESLCGQEPLADHGYIILS